MAKLFNPGRFRHRITFLRHTGDRDESGELLSDAWIPYKLCYASKSPILGREFFTALTTDVKVEVKFNMRYIPGVANDMRIQCGDDLYEIISAIDVKSAHKELLCYCRLVK